MIIRDTSRPVKDWSLQEVFDHVVRHLGELRVLGQKSAFTDSMGEPTTCRYRNGAGLACAVGCLIPDELYTPVIEDRDAFDAMRCGQLEGWFIDEEKGEQHLTELLLDVQKLHDDARLDEWDDGLRRVASTHGLSDSAISEAFPK